MNQSITDSCIFEFVLKKKPLKLIDDAVLCRYSNLFLSENENLRILTAANYFQSNMRTKNSSHFPIRVMPDATDKG